MNDYAEMIRHGLESCCEVKGCDFEIDYDDESITFKMEDRNGEIVNCQVRFVDVVTTSVNNIVKGVYIEFLSYLY